MLHQGAALAVGSSEWTLPVQPCTSPGLQVLLREGDIDGDGDGDLVW